MCRMNLHPQAAALHWKSVPLTAAQPTLQTPCQVLSIMFQTRSQPKEVVNNRFHSGPPPPFPSSIPPENGNPLIHSQIPTLGPCVWDYMQPGRRLQIKIWTRGHRSTVAPSLHPSPPSHAHPARSSDFIQGTRFRTLPTMPTPPPELTQSSLLLLGENQASPPASLLHPAPPKPALRTPPGVFNAPISGAPITPLPNEK